MIKMAPENSDKKFDSKHKSDAQPDNSIKYEILKHSLNNELSCASAFLIAKEFNVSPDKVGMTADLINCRFIKCQMGLFGYRPDKKIIKPVMTADLNLKNAIVGNIVEGRLACKIAWDIASRFKLNKMTVSSICEGMNIKINKCQLGAF
ncbi:MAG: hypothetical protein L6302_07850 [Desulfobacteraceae bacterium]|nr:hypothetical protein [Pseudomonadota bacterium]MCG2830949.1 hypothetical protein [Desulfobacteraceae bacterium]